MCIGRRDPTILAIHVPSLARGITIDNNLEKFKNIKKLGRPGTVELNRL